MKKTFKIALIITLLSSFCLSQAETIQPQKKEKNILRYPIGCFPVGFKFENQMLILSRTAKYNPQSLFLIHNISDSSVSLWQTMSGEEPYIMHSNTTITPKMWSVFSTDEKSVKFICTNKNINKNTPPHNVIDCKPLLEICEFPHTKFGNNQRGTYWMVQNNTMSGAALGAQRQGVLLIDPSKTKQNKKQGSV